jgi:two-component system, cell cycle response regulator
MIRQTFEELKLTNRLPSPPGVGMRVLEITRGEDFSADDIANAIMADSALTGRLLKIANSAQNGAGQPITTVSEATMRLGVRSVRNVALGLSLISANRTGGCEKFEYERYWSMSLARGVAAQAISRVKNVGSPSEAYVVGLLCEIGTLALASVYPREYATLLAAHPGLGVAAFGRFERETFEIDHCEVGTYMLEDWGIPQQQAEALLAYEGFGQLVSDEDRQANPMAGVLWAAQAIVEMLFADENAGADVWNGHAGRLESVRAYLDLEEHPFNDLCESISREWQEWNGILKLPKRSPLRLEQVSQRAGGVQPGLEPAPQAPAGEQLATLVGEEPKGSPGLRILAVDDDPMSLKLLERTLRKAGHHVTCARDGREALQIALETNPQVVLADWMMPELDGLDLCRALRRIESGQDMYFLLLTGRDDEDRVVEAFEAGVDDYVAKPFNARILMARLKGGQRVIELKAKVDANHKTMMQQVAELGAMTRKLRTAALTDALTELPNRRYIMKRLEQEWDSADRTARPLSVIMIDIDHFKKVNDIHGHDVGDVVLKETANVLKGATRQGEEVARLGGEEFLVVCPNSSLAQARVCAERIRLSIERRVIQSGSFNRNVTVSLGVAERLPTTANHEALFKAADEAVYAAKNGGRNQVRCAGDAAPVAKSA